MFKRMLSYFESFLRTTKKIATAIIINTAYACVQVYILASNFGMKVFALCAPDIMLLKTWSHEPNEYNFGGFKVYEYMYNNKNKFYRFKYVEDSKVTFDLYNIHDNITKHSLINHCCILNNDTYIKDITNDIKKFAHLDKKIEWRYIFIHLGVSDGQSILINLNDDDLTSKHITKNLENDTFNLM